MPKSDAEAEVIARRDEVEQLIDRLGTLSDAGQQATATCRESLQEIDGRLGTRKDGTLDLEATGKLERDVLRKIDDDLATLRARVEDALEETPRGAGLMSSQLVSRWGVVLLALLSLSGAYCVLERVLHRWNEAVAPANLAEPAREIRAALDALADARKFIAENPAGAGTVDVEAAEKASADLKQARSRLETNSATLIDGLTAGAPTERDVLLMVMLMGTLGGMTHVLGSLALYVGNRRLMRSWVLYYLTVPLQGAALATIVYLLLRVGLLNAATASGSQLAGMNVVGVYAFAGLTGLFSRIAIEKLYEVFRTLFKSDEARYHDKAKAKHPG